MKKPTRDEQPIEFDISVDDYASSADRENPSLAVTQNERDGRSSIPLMVDSSELALSIGAYLQNERESQGVSIEEVAQTTRIPLRMLRCLESDDYDALPGDVFARGYIKSYGRSLNINTDKLVARYSTETAVVDPAPFSNVETPERGKRFGIALAVVVLFILFTLALSIVLRPRPRSVPIELSQNMFVEPELKVSELEVSGPFESDGPFRLG